MIAPVVWLIQAIVTIYLVLVILAILGIVALFVRAKIEQHRQDCLAEAQERRQQEIEIHQALYAEMVDEIRWRYFLTEEAAKIAQKNYEDNLFGGGKIEEMRNDFH